MWDLSTLTTLNDRAEALSRIGKERCVYSPPVEIYPRKQEKPRNEQVIPKYPRDDHE